MFRILVPKIFDDEAEDDFAKLFILAVEQFHHERDDLERGY